MRRWVYFSLLGTILPGLCLGCQAPSNQALPFPHTHSDVILEPRAATRNPIQPIAPTGAIDPENRGADLPLFSGTELTAAALTKWVLERNPSLAQMEQAWQAASARYPQVIALDDPMFGFTAAPASIGSNDVEFGYRLEVTQKFPLGGKRGLRGESALAEASAAGHDVEDMRLQLVESAKHALAEYHLADRALVVNAEGLRLLRTFRERAKDRYQRVPGANEQDIAQADLELGRQEQKQITLQRMRALAIGRLNTLLHRAAESTLPPSPKELTVVASLPDEADLSLRARAHRPDLQAVAERIRGDEAVLALAERETCPDVEVAAAYDTIMGNGPTRDLAPQVGVRLNMPLQRDRRRAAVAEARARLGQRRAELARLTDQVNFQVHEAVAQVRESQRLVQLYESKLLPAARENVKAAEASYAGGRIPFISLVEAERGVVEFQDRYYESVAERYRRWATLERVIGASSGSSSSTDGNCLSTQ